MSNHILELVLVKKTEMDGDVAIFPPILKCRHCPVVTDISILVSEVLSSDYVCMWKIGKYAEINEELD